MGWAVTNGSPQSSRFDGMPPLFYQNCLIFDNILVAFEALHSMTNHKTSKTGYMAHKLDMSKTYDRVKWSFLEQIMRRLEFEENWINLMMICVKSVSYSILVNGESKGLIHLTRGIHQGDSLFPFLFLFVHIRFT